MAAPLPLPEAGRFRIVAPVTAGAAGRNSVQNAARLRGEFCHSPYRIGGNSTLFYLTLSVGLGD